MALCDAAAPLGEQIKPCGPVRDHEASERVRERLIEAAEDAGWVQSLERAWPALQPVFAASGYLAGLARRWPERLRQVIECDPEATPYGIVGL